jgi:peroxiredoxin
MIGIARDDSITLTNFIQKHGIKYPNAIGNTKLFTDYGIIGYPTTFLISPDGKIIAKNLRGENVVQLVRNTIEEYWKTKKSK